MNNKFNGLDLPWSVSPLEDGAMICDNAGAPIVGDVRQEEGVYIVTSCNLRPHLEAALKALIDESERVGLAASENGQELLHLWNAIHYAKNIIGLSDKSEAIKTTS